MTDFTPGRFRKKPVEIEAVQWHTGDAEQATGIIDWALASGGTIRFHDQPNQLSINTLEGTMLAQPGDWIIRGIKGEFYPCRDDIFRATYEPAQTTEETPNA